MSVCIGKIAQRQHGLDALAPCFANADQYAAGKGYLGAAGFGDAYVRWAEARGAFLLGSPIHRLFEATFGRLRPRPLGWLTAYAVCLAVAFALGFALRDYTRANIATLPRPEQRAMVLSTWPKPGAWMAKVFDAVVSDTRVRQRLADARGDEPVVATILPPGYGMKGMYYVMPARSGASAGPGGPQMGVDPDNVDAPVEVVLSRAEKPYHRGMALEEALDAGVRLIPLVVVTVVPASGEVTDVEVVESGGNALDEPVRQALLRWRFAPGAKQGTKVKVRMARKYTFRSG